MSSHRWTAHLLYQKPVEHSGRGEEVVIVLVRQSSPMIFYATCLTVWYFLVQQVLQFNNFCCDRCDSLAVFGVIELRPNNETETRRIVWCLETGPCYFHPQKKIPQRRRCIMTSTSSPVCLAFFLMYWSTNLLTVLKVKGISPAHGAWNFSENVRPSSVLILVIIWYWNLDLNLSQHLV